MQNKGARIEVFDIVNAIIMFLVAFIMVIPFWFCLVGSFNEGVDYLRGGVYFWPRTFTLGNYRAVFVNNIIVRAAGVTVLRTIIGTVTHILFTLMAAYAMSRPNLKFKNFYKEDKDGNYLDAFHQPEALEAAKFLNQLYREGLMPEDVLTMNTQMLRERIARGEVFSFTGHLYDSTDALMNALYNIDNTAYNVHVGPIHNDNNDEPTLGVSPLAGWTISMITKQTEHPDRCIYLFDFLYSGDDIHITTWYGPQGEAWEWVDESKTEYKMTEQYLKDFEEDPSAAAAKYTNGGFEWLANWIPIRKGMPVPTEEHLKAGYESDMYFSQWGLYDLPFTGINPPGGTDLAGVAARVDEIQLEYVAKMITANSEAEVEAFFNEMIEKKKEVGYDELHEYRNEQFQKNKEKLGMGFAWPTNQK